MPGHCVNALFCCAVTMIFSQRLLNKMTNSCAVLIAPQDLASILAVYLVQCVCRYIGCAQGKRSLHSRWNFIFNFHRVTRTWRWTLTNGSDVKDVFPARVVSTHSPQTPHVRAQYWWKSSPLSQRFLFFTKMSQSGSTSWHSEESNSDKIVHFAGHVAI